MTRARMRWQLIVCGDVLMVGLALLLVGLALAVVLVAVLPAGDPRTLMAALVAGGGTAAAAAALSWATWLREHDPDLWRSAVSYPASPKLLPRR